MSVVEFNRICNSTDPNLIDENRCLPATQLEKALRVHGCNTMLRKGSRAPHARADPTNEMSCGARGVTKSLDRVGAALRDD